MSSKSQQIATAISTTNQYERLAILSSSSDSLRPARTKKKSSKPQKCPPGTSKTGGRPDRAHSASSSTNTSASSSSSDNTASFSEAFDSGKKKISGKDLVPLTILAIRVIANNIDHWAGGLTPFHLNECRYILSPFHELSLPDHLVQEIIDELASLKKINLPILCLFLHSSLQYLNLSRCAPMLNDKLLKQIADRAPNIVNLDASSCHKMSNASAVYIISRMRHLRSINFSGCNKLTDEVVLELVARDGGRQVKSLILAGVDKLTDVAVDTMTNKMPSLESLDLYGCSRITDASLGRFLAGCCSSSSSSLTSTSTCASTSTTATLRELKLGGMWEVGDEAMKQLKGEGLETLDLAVTSVGTQGMHHIQSVCRSLKHLSLEGCTLLADDAFIDASPTGDFGSRLESLRLGGCQMITGVGFVAMFANGVFGSNLRMLHLPPKVTDEAFLTVMNRLTNLEELVIDGCTEITDRMFMSFKDTEIAGTGDDKLGEGTSSSSSSSSLSSSAKRERKKRDPFAPHNLCHRFFLPQLRSLSCVGCNQLTDVALRCIGRGDAAPLLEELDMRGCDQFTDRGLASLAASCSGLRRLDISEAGKVTAAGIESVLRKATRAEVVVIRQCAAVSRVEWNELQHRFPFVRIVWE